MPFLDEPLPPPPAPLGPADRSKETRLLMGVAGGSVLLMLVLLGLAYDTIRDHQAQDNELHLSQEVQQRIIEVRALFHDAESAFHTYLLCDDANELGAFGSARERLDPAIRQLTEALPGKGTMATRVSLRLAADDAFRVMTHLIQEQRSGRALVARPDPEQWASYQSGRDKLLRITDDLLKEHDAKRAAAGHGAGATHSLAPLSILFYALIALGGIAILFFRLLRTLDRTRKAEAFAREAGAARDREMVIRDRAERNLKRVVDSSPSGIMAFRSVRDDHGRIADFRLGMVNAGAGHLLGQELVQDRMLSDMPGLYTSDLFDRFVRVVESGEPLRTEHHNTEGGKDTWFDLGAERLLDGFVVTLSDATLRKNEQQLLQETQRLAVTGRFARMVAHEVRNPLTNIHLALDHLDSEAPPSPESLPYFSILKRNADRIGDLITRMLHTSRPMDMKLVPGAINAVLLEAHEMVKDRCTLKGVENQLHLTEDLPFVRMDREALVIAFVNLCVNAIEAMEPGSGRLIIASVENEGRILVDIADNGKGLTPEEQEQIFQPFFSGRKGGMGLGLTEARNILNGHHVLLSLDSMPGQGTTFHLSFPGVS